MAIKPELDGDPILKPELTGFLELTEDRDGDGESSNYETKDEDSINPRPELFNICVPLSIPSDWDAIFMGGLQRIHEKKAVDNCWSNGFRKHVSKLDMLEIRRLLSMFMLSVTRNWLNLFHWLLMRESKEHFNLPPLSFPFAVCWPEVISA
nr:hypothetical protein [Tanacetum cinerariifolium]